MRADRGQFIVVEGGDGAGKTTQIKLLAEKLDAVVTGEPGGTLLGCELRALILDGGDVDPVAEAFLYAADRAHHVATVIRPALDAGRNVICSRFTWSSLAYQGIGRGLGVDMIADIDRIARGGLEADLTLLFDLDPAVGAVRSGRRGELDRIERAGDEFHRKVRAAMLELADQSAAAEVIDAAGTPDAVHALVLDALERHGISV